MDIEQIYKDAYVFQKQPTTIEINGVSDMEKELKNAPTIQELSYKLHPQYKEIYLAYAKNELSKNEMNYTADREITKLNFSVIQSLYRDGYSYEDMICVISAAPSCQQDNAGMTRLAAAWQVASAVNPIVNIPQLLCIADKKENISMSNMSIEELYYANLKKEMYRHPEQSLADADKKIIAILLHNDYDEDFIQQVMKNSPNYNSDFYALPEDDIERIEVLHEVESNFQTFLYEAINSPIKLDNDNKIEADTENNDLTYEKLMQQINDIKKHQNSIELFNYWKKTMDCFTEALIQSTKAKTICRILDTWSDSINKAAKQINEPLPTDMQGITEIIKAYKDTTRLEENDWEAIYQIANEMSKFSTKLLSDTLEITKKNPLLKYPKVYAAVPFEELLRSHSHPAEMIYYSALRKAVLNTPGVGIYEADEKVKEILDTQKVLTDKHKATILSFSPRYRGTASQAQRISEAGEWLKSLDHAQKQDYH